MKKKVLIIGGAGYVGSMLALDLVKQGFEVTIYDLLIYQSILTKKKIKDLNIIKGDVRDVDKLLEVTKFNDIIFHLACISNDPSFELDPNLGKSINYDCFKPYISGLHKMNDKKFIYASSSSVYGLKSEINVTEESSLEPLTDYSKFKAQCEDILFSFNKPSICKTIIRPATVCGYSVRQRLDVVVNIFTNLAYHLKKISINGGEQLRPNIHIKDMIRVYNLIANTDYKKVNNKIYNAGIENISLNDIAKKVCEVINFDIYLNHIKTDDNRSYHISSEKIKNELNFKFEFTVNNAIEDLINAFKENLLTDTLDNIEYYNIKKMNDINLI